MSETKKRSTTGFYGTEQLSNPCAYCAKHRLALTVNVLKRRNCLGKQCNALRRNPEHPYWQKREDKKQLRRDRKARLEAEYLKVVGGDADAVQSPTAPADRG